MGDFMDVPDFDGPGVFARATDAAWLAHGQTQKEKAAVDGERKRKKGSAKGATAAAAGRADADAAGEAKKRKRTGDDWAGDEDTQPRRGADGERRRDAGSAGGKQRGAGGASAQPAEKGRKAKKAEEPERVSGKNMGRRRRAQAKREARRVSAGGEGAAGDAAEPDDAAAAAERPAAKQQQKHQKQQPRVSAEEAARAAKKAQLVEKRRLQRSGAAEPPVAAPAPAAKAAKPSVLDKAAAQLAGGRFRWLNEALYTRDGSGAWALLSGEPAMFAEYHEGFRKQTAAWPRQPLDECIAWLRRCPTTWAVADFGCGDARLAAAAPQATVHSFDLVAAAPGVVACDMCAVPLPDGAVQAAVFCLSLMGTDYGLALAEAHRVLAPRGALWIAEVRSRFEGAQGGVDAFVRALAALGFTLRSRDESDTMFAVLRLVKADAPGSAKPPRWPALKACEYKRR